jgi:hypothetical protein
MLSKSLMKQHQLPPARSTQAEAKRGARNRLCQHFVDRPPDRHRVGAGADRLRAIRAFKK